MYADPKQIKENRVPVNLSTYAHERLMLLVSLRGGQKAAVARDALEEGIDLLLHELESARIAQQLPEPTKSQAHP